MLNYVSSMEILLSPELEGKSTMPASAQNCHHIGTDPRRFRKFIDSISFFIKMSHSSTPKHFTKYKSCKGQNVGLSKAKTGLKS